MIAPFIRQQIIELAARGMPPKSIVGQLRVSIGTVYSVLHKARTRGEPIPKFSMGLARGLSAAPPRSRRRCGRFLKPDDRLLAARDARAVALDARTITATLMGDPPPGYSALDDQGKSR